MASAPCAVNASSPQSYVHARCSRLSRAVCLWRRTIARQAWPTSYCQLKVLLALAIIQQPLRFLVQAAVIVFCSLEYSAHICQITVARGTHQQPLKPQLRSIRSPPGLLASAKSETMPWSTGSAGPFSSQMRVHLFKQSDALVNHAMFAHKLADI
jgi:hypothetical protein